MPAAAAIKLPAADACFACCYCHGVAGFYSNSDTGCSCHGNVLAVIQAAADQTSAVAMATAFTTMMLTAAHHTAYINTCY